MEKATFAAGCFWGVEESFRTLPGVQTTMVGYTGGHRDHPTYEEVCASDTGHAEAVQVLYDPGAVSYGQLLEVFFRCHDPTQLNRQGPDVGTQYRSVIFYNSPEQETEARAAVAELDSGGRFPRPVVTQVMEAATFWPAEEYHQKYLHKRGGGSCGI